MTPKPGMRLCRCIGRKVWEISMGVANIGGGDGGDVILSFTNLMKWYYIYIHGVMAFFLLFL